MDSFTTIKRLEVFSKLSWDAKLIAFEHLATSAKIGELHLHFSTEALAPLIIS